MKKLQKPRGKTCPRHIVKRAGHRERWDERKVYASCYAACLASHVPEQEAERISGQVTAEIWKWACSREVVTAHEIFLRTAAALKKRNRNAAFMYETHRDIG